eukprot:4580326-Alexandrium_andersonii.AAC.1
MCIRDSGGRERAHRGGLRMLHRLLPHGRRRVDRIPPRGGGRGRLRHRAGRLPPAGRVHQEAWAQVRMAREEGPLWQAQGCAALAA